MLIQILIAGLAMGGIYALVALGFVLLVNSVNIINFAQGEFLMLGAFLVYTFGGLAGLPFPLALLFTLLAAALFGLLFERFAYWPLRHQGVVSVIVATMGISVFMKNSASLVWGGVPLAYTEPFGGLMWSLGSLRLAPQHILILAVTFALVVLQQLFFQRTRMGQMMLATSQDKMAASLVGIRVRVITVFTFVYATVLGALAGVLVAPTFYITVDMGAMVGLKAFVSIVLGGWGSIPGAILGGLLLGVLESLLAAYVSSLYKDVFAFLILIAVLVCLPRGLFGERVSEKV